MRRILFALICVTGVAFSGCQSKNQLKQEKMTAQELNNRQKLHPIPFAVTESFLRDHPNATITSAYSYRDSSGRKLYRVDFIEKSRTASTVYTPTGERPTAAMAHTD